MPESFGEFVEWDEDEQMGEWADEVAAWVVMIGAALLMLGLLGVTIVGVVRAWM